jgi:hypothetical protein
VSCFYQDYTQREIATELGISTGLVGRYLALRSQVPRQALSPRAREALKSKLANLEADLTIAMPRALAGDLDYTLWAIKLIKASCHWRGLYQQRSERAVLPVHETAGTSLRSNVG